MVVIVVIVVVVALSLSILYYHISSSHLPILLVFILFITLQLSPLLLPRFHLSLYESRHRPFLLGEQIRFVSFGYPSMPDVRALSPLSTY